MDVLVQALGVGKARSDTLYVPPTAVAWSKVFVARINPHTA